MKFHYYSETDSLYIDLADRTSTDSLEVSPGVVIDLDSEQRIVGIDIEDASRVVDLSCLEAEAVAHSLTYRLSLACLQASEPGLKRPVVASVEARNADAD